MQDETEQAWGTFPIFYVDRDSSTGELEILKVHVGLNPYPSVGREFASYPPLRYYSEDWVGRTPEEAVAKYIKYHENLMEQLENQYRGFIAQAQALLEGV